MSSDGETNANGDGGPIKMKRRRLHGACDLCRQKKIRCDSSKRPGNKCSNCIAFGSECTHVHVNQKIGLGYRSSRHGLAATADSASVADLRKSMDPLLKTILSPTYQAPTNPAIIRETLVNLARYSRALEGAIEGNSASPSTVVKLPPPPASSASPPPISTTTAAMASCSSRRPTPESATSSPQILPPTFAMSAGANAARWPHGRGSVGTRLETQGPVSCNELLALAQNFKRSIVLTSVDERFFGPSSSVSLLDTAIEMGERDPQMRPPPTKGAMQFMRPEFWTVHPWEQAPPPNDEPYDFPPPDLLNHLAEIFFTHINIYLPLLHRPTFLRGIESGLHLKDPGFGGTVLGVCATASRYSNDERVLLEGTDSLHSSGFKYYKQLRIFHESSLRAPSLHELQTLVLAAMYLQGSSTPEKCWFLVGFAIRAALDVGMNRKAKGDGTPSVEDELRKRVFWTLVAAESWVTSTVGRPPSLSLVDFDCELPVDCDDEYWENEDPEKAFKQPPGQPTKISFFRCLINLFEIQYAAQRAFYSVRHPEVPPGVTNEEWDSATLANLDSALNAWVDSVPTHLRWDPYHPNKTFLDQSGMLFATFYFVQIFVHRPFIASHAQPALAFSSLAICTNAARACSRIMEAQSTRGFLPVPQIQVALFSSGLMLLLSIWRGRRSGFALMDEDKELKAVFGVINVLKTYENKWHLAGRFSDLLMALSSVGGLRLTPPSQVASKLAASNKRSRQAREDEDRQAREEEDRQSLATTRPRSQMETSRPGGSMDVEVQARPMSSGMADHHPRLSSRFGGPGSTGGELFGTTAPPFHDLGAPSTSMSYESDSAMQSQGPPESLAFPLYSSELSRPFFRFNPEEEPSAPSRHDRDLETVLQQMSDAEFESLFGSRNQADSGFDGDGMGDAGSSRSNGSAHDYRQMLLPGGQTGQRTNENAASGSLGGGGGHGFMNANGDMSGNDSGSRTFHAQSETPGNSHDIFIDLQNAAMWTGMPAGGDWQDWSTYLPNVESLSSVQRLSSSVGAGSSSMSGGFSQGQPDASLGTPDPMTGTPSNARQRALRYLQQQRLQGGSDSSEAQRQQLERLRYGW